MQIKQTLLRLLFLFLPAISAAQTTYFNQGAKENTLIERLEIKAGRDSTLNFSKTRPYSREQYIPMIEKYYNAGRLVKSAGEIPPILNDTLVELYHTVSSLSRVDLFNAETALMNSPEWSGEQFGSKKKFLHHFYTNPANFYEVNTKDFYLSVNPVFQFLGGKESKSPSTLFLNTRGAVLRGRLANKIGFAAYITDNQERNALYVRDWETKYKSVPGAGYYKTFKNTGYDYFDARGYFTFGVTKYIDVAFGYDKNFIGNGYRSLFLSDFSNSNLFLKLNTRIWKFNYQNLFMELTGDQPRGRDTLFPKKYATLHHLDIDVTRWLNIGLFESVVFGRKDHFDFGYLNPVIFYRSIEQQNGSFDNSLAGLDVKANLAKKFQLYGQLLLDEFKLSEIKAGRGWWGNKFAFQAGGKYIDAFNVSNLDIQIEANRVRPFTYTHDNTIADYTHYNQPLAHPLGANFQEMIGIVRYQPAPKWLIQGKIFYWYQGKDLAGVNYGSNIFLPNATRTGEYGYSLGSGLKTKTVLASGLLSYELKPDFFIEANGAYRRETAAGIAEKSSFILFAGVRWNMHRREFEF